MRFLVLPAAIFLLAAIAWADEPPLVTITVHGDRVEYDQELNTIAVQGQVQVTARSDKPGAPTVSMAAEQVEGDLAHGLIIAHGGINLLTQQAALKGETVRLNVKTDEFVMESGAASVDAPATLYPGRTVRGFFTGDKLSREGKVVIVIEGRITTCDRAHPHYSIGARRITYDLEKHSFRLEHGRITLYGRSLSLPGQVTLSLGGPSEGGGPYLPIPSFSTYDGLFVNFTRTDDWPGVPWKVSSYVHLGTSLRFPAGVAVSNKDDAGVFTASLTRREQEIWDFNRRSRVDRVPELRYVRHLQPVGPNLSRLDAEVYAGYLYERVEDEPLREGLRAGAALHYSPMPRQRQRHDGFWTAADLYQSFYNDGDSLTDLRLEAGTGWKLNDHVAGAVWGVHHESSGASPFRFDDVYSANEGYASLDLHLDTRNRLELYGRYDFDRSEMRDYSAKYSYRAHCLTWNIEYNLARQALTLGVDLNGLTGDTPPTETAPLVRPEEVPPLPEPVPGPNPFLPAPKQ